MHEVDELREALESEYPTTTRVGDWEDVLVRTPGARPSRRRRRAPLIALAAAVTAVGLGVLLWPAIDGPPDVLERARAVASDGPVIHLILGPKDARMTEIDLDTGKRRRLQSRHEQWFDPDRGFHDVRTVAGQVIDDIFYPAGSSPETAQRILALEEYRKALETGKVSVAGKGEVDGRAVYWLHFHVRYPSFGIPHYAADEQVAVDAETYVPRFWRSIPTKDSMVREVTEDKIELWETLPAGLGDFTARTNAVELQPTQTPLGWGVSRPLTLESARKVLSPPLWLGREFRGLRLVQLSQQGWRRSRRSGPVRLLRALDLCYARRLDECIGHTLVPDQPFVSLSEKARADFGAVPRPREGKLILTDWVRVPGPIPTFQPGYARRHGVFVAVQASSPRLLLEAARALRPVR